MEKNREDQWIGYVSKSLDLEGILDLFRLKLLFRWWGHGPRLLKYDLWVTWLVSAKWFI